MNKKLIIGLLVLVVLALVLSSCKTEGEARRTPRPKPSPTPAPYCGDAKCGGNETCSNCAQDCGTCPPPNSCIDSDGGLGLASYTIQGTVSGYYNGTSYSYTDYCQSTILNEYYCFQNRWYKQSVNCVGLLNLTAGNQTTNCLNGACV